MFRARRQSNQNSCWFQAIWLAIKIHITSRISSKCFSRKKNLRPIGCRFAGNQSEVIFDLCSINLYLRLRSNYDPNVRSCTKILFFKSYSHHNSWSLETRCWDQTQSGYWTGDCSAIAFGKCNQVHFCEKHFLVTPTVLVSFHIESKKRRERKRPIFINFQVLIRFFHKIQSRRPLGSLRTVLWAGIQM